jgi:uncharacterized protein YndB with AHSA1/START domain
MIDESLQIARLVNAPRLRVWAAWTEPAELARWWWPARFQTTYEVDLREGGVYRFQSADLPDIGVLGVTGRFLLVRPPEELRYTWRWLHEERESEVRAVFADRGAQTEIVITHLGLAGAEERANHATGWNDCIDRLAVLAVEDRLPS